MIHDDDPDSVREGDVLADRYRVGALIGAGGYGRVFRATQISSGLEVAVKVIHGIDDELRARFAQEVRIVEGLRSPHTVRVLDSGISRDGMPFMALELLRGTSVHQLLEQHGTLSPGVALEITHQVLVSLEEAHSIGVVHRDIKPENVFVTSGFGQPTFVKLLDFGIAKQSSRGNLTVQGQVVGTPSYMAPEQTSGGVVDARTDLYAVGLLLAEMVTGQTVMGSGGPVTIMVAQARKTEIQLSEELRHSLVGPLVARAVRKSPVERYQSAAEMRRFVEATIARVNATDAPDTSRDPQPAGERATLDVNPTHFAVAPRPAVGDALDTTPYRRPASTRQPCLPSPPPLSPPPLSSPPLSPPPLSPPPLSSSPCPDPIAEIAPVPPRELRRKRGGLLVPLAIVGAAAALAVAIVVLASGSRSRRDLSPRTFEHTPPERPEKLHPKVRIARTSDIAVMRRTLRGAGYALTFDSGNASVHSFVAEKLPCAGSITVLHLQDGETARSVANRNASGVDGGTVHMVDGGNVITVGIATSEGARGVDGACTAAVVALFEK